MAAAIDFDTYDKVQGSLFIIFLIAILITNGGFLTKLFLQRRREVTLQKLLTLVSIIVVDIVHALFPFPVYIYHAFYTVIGFCSRLQLVTTGYEYYVPLVYCLGLMALMAELLLRQRINAAGSHLVTVLSSLAYAAGPHLVGILVVCSIYYGSFSPENCALPRDIYLALTLISSVLPCVAAAVFAFLLLFLPVTQPRGGHVQQEDPGHVTRVVEPFTGRGVNSDPSAEPVPEKGGNSELSGRSAVAPHQEGPIQWSKGDDSLLVSNVSEPRTSYRPLQPSIASPGAGSNKEKITLLVLTLVTSFCHLIHGVPVSLFFNREVMESMDELSFFIFSGFTSWMSQLRPILTGVLWWLLY